MSVPVTSRPASGRRGFARWLLLAGLLAPAGAALAQAPASAPAVSYPKGTSSTYPTSSGSTPTSTAVAGVRADGKPGGLLAGSTSGTAGVLPNRIGLTPVINSFGPASGLAGTPVTFAGTGLDLVTGVRFGTGTLTTNFISQSATSLTVLVPVVSSTGVVTLTNSLGATGSTATAFTYAPRLNLVATLAPTASQTVCQPRTLTAAANSPAFTASFGAGSSLNSVAVQPDGKVLAGGGFTTYNGTAGQNNLVRLNADGTRDVGFATGTGFSSSVYGIAVQADGKVLVGGAFTSYNTTTANYLARLNADGTVDTGFNAGGTGFNGIVYSIVVQADGKLLVGGGFTTYNTLTAQGLVRLNADGTRDTDFNSGGAGISGSSATVRSVAVQADGKVVVGGIFTSYNATTANYLMRLNTDGTRDVGFATGTGFNSVVYGVAVQADGKLLIGGGGFTTYNNVAVPSYLARLNANGNVDTGFNAGGTGFNSTVLGVAVQADGKVLATGGFSTYNSTTGQTRIARISTDGTLDTGFAPTGTGFNAFMRTVAVQADGRVLAGGDFSSYNGNSSPDRLARLNTDGTLNNTATAVSGASFTFSPGGSTTNPLVTSTAGSYTATATLSGETSAPSNAVVLTACPAPVLSTLNPTSGPVGTSVTLTGTNLTGATTVTFGGTANNTVTGLTVSGTTTQTITVAVPSGATTGNVTVTTAGGASNGVAFTVTTTPTVTTAAATTIAATSAVLGGNVTATGNTTVTERGVVYSPTNATPATGGGTNGTQAANGTGQGAYSATIAGLTASTLYYVRAYAINSLGTSYGAVQTFTTTTVLDATAVVTSVSCNGGSNGTIILTATGGTSPYAFNWGSSITSKDRSSLPAGSYTVTVTDAVGTSISRTFTVTQPAAISFGTVQTNIACFGTSTGQATVNGVSGGTGPYTYAWQRNTAPTGPVAASSGTATSSTISGLAAGSYSVTITDANTCNLTRTFTISQPTAALAASQSQANVTTVGGTDGSATVVVSGGTPAYTYTWSPSVSTTATAANLSAGTYSVTVADVYGCSLVRSFTITQPTATVATVTTAAPTIIGSSRATLGGNVTATGGVTVTERGVVYLAGAGTPTTSNTKVTMGSGLGTFGQVVPGLAASTLYTVRAYAINSAGTSYGTNLTFTTAAPLGGTTVVTNVTCFGGTTGAINLTPTGGLAPYTFNWGGGIISEDRMNLGAGSYSVVITDASGATATVGATVTQPTSALALGGSQTDATTNGGTNGTATVTATGGTPGYSYSWSPGSPAGNGTATVTGLSAGTYSVLVSDAYGCTATRSFTITQPALPTLTSLSPPSGPVGTSVTLTGTNLTGATAVTFGGTTANTVTGLTVSGSTTQTITVAVPSGAATGNVTVTTPNGVTNGVAFTVVGPLTVSAGTPAAPVVVAAGTYTTLTVTSSGVAQLGGAVVVNTAVVVDGTLLTNCQPLTGTGTFTLSAGATLNVCDVGGISASGSTGAVQVSGVRSFSPDASYVYSSIDIDPQPTGSGLPATVRNLTNATVGTLYLTQPVAVTQVVTLAGSSNLTLNGQALTLLSTAAGTALIANLGTGVVNGTTGTMQRHIETNPTAGGYRQYASPMTPLNGAETLATLATAGYVPDFSGAAAYNSAAAPGLVTPFPTVFFYNQDRIASSPSNYTTFDKGWQAAQGTEIPEGGRGYSVQAPGAALIDFTGAFASGSVTRNNLSRASADPNTGWHLLGNPFPSPLDWSTMTLGTGQSLEGMDGAVYVSQSTGPYVGSYRTYLAAAPGQGSPVIPAGSGFFVHTSSAATPGIVRFTGANRVTTFAAQPAFGRTAADTRPALTLAVQGNGVADAVSVYFDAAATAGLDAPYDAAKLPNGHGLNLATLAGATALAIEGRPAPTAATVLPLSLGVPAAGVYTLSVPALDNFGAFTLYLRDAQTGTDRLLTAGTTVPVTLPASATASLRFSLVLRPAGALAATGAVLAAQASLFPNPAHGAFTLRVPPVAGATQATATLLNALGQVVATRTLALPASGTTAGFSTAGLATGVYALRLTAGAEAATLRVVVE